MHHDIRTPLIVDYLSPEARVYANPLRTCHHRCEVDLVRIRRDLGLPAYGKLLCEYHDCCLVREEVWSCPQYPRVAAAATEEEEEEKEEEGEDEGGEPEECEAFVLEHRHTPLHTWEVVARWAAMAGAPEPGVLPVGLWQPYAELAWDRDWRPVYHQDRRLYPRWQEAVFALGEQLHRRRADRDVHEAVLLDITRCPAAADWETRAAAVDNYFGAAHALSMLEMHIHEAFYLAATPL